MSFRRTDSGLSSMHKFLGVDAVVFVEGGATAFTLQQVYAGSYSAQADDIKYWQVVFSNFAPARNLHFRAVGSKGTIKEIAALILSGKVTRVLAAMDRDFDHLNNSLPRSGGIFHTLGYSWENDVWTEAVVLAAFKRFSNIPEAEKAVAKEIFEHFGQARRKLRHCVAADVMLASQGLQLLHRDKFRKVCRPSKNGPPSFSQSAARAVVTEASRKARPHRIMSKPVADPVRDCYGHLWGFFGYHLLVHVLRKYCRVRVTPKELLVPAVIDSFRGVLKSDALLANHYSPMFAATNWN
jgi:hypothetical protein